LAVLRSSAGASTAVAAAGGGGGSGVGGAGSTIEAVTVSAGGGRAGAGAGSGIPHTFVSPSDTSSSFLSEQDLAQRFYLITGIGLLVAWATYSLGLGHDFHTIATRCSLVTRPRWLPGSWISAWQRFLRRWGLYIPLCHAAPIVCILTGVCPHMKCLRLLTALLVSTYNLSDTSLTNSHRDYLASYGAWVFLLCRDVQMEQGAMLGCVVYFLSASGFSKARIGGWKAWSTTKLHQVLRDYANLLLSQGGPLAPKLTRWLMAHDGLMTGPHWLFPNRGATSGGGSSHVNSCQDYGE